MNKMLSIYALITVASTAFCICHADGELILLVAAHVGVTHVEERVVVTASRGRHKVQLDLGLLLQG